MRTPLNNAIAARAARRADLADLTNRMRAAFEYVLDGECVSRQCIAAFAIELVELKPVPQELHNLLDSIREVNAVLLFQDEELQAMLAASDRACDIASDPDYQGYLAEQAYAALTDGDL